MRRRCHYLLLATLSVVPLAPAHGQRSALPSPEKPSPRLRSMHLTGQVAGVIQDAFHLYGVTVVFVYPIEGLTRPIAVNLTDADLATTAEVLDAMAHCFFVPVNENTVLAVQDDKAHRSHYERLFTETIVIPNLQAGDADERSEVEGLLSSVFGITKSTLRGNAVTVRATKRDLLQIEDTLTHLFQPQPQVLLEIKAYIVSRNHNRDLGVQTPQRIKIFNVDSEAESLISSNSSVVAELIKAGIVTAGDTLGIAEALIAEGYGSNSVLSSSFVTLGGGITSTGVQFGSVPANASLTTSSSQQLQSALLQLGNAQTGKLRVGQRYPVETASTKALGGSSSTSTPTIQYEDLGLTLEAKPQVLSQGEVLLHIHGTLRALEGTSLNGIPIIDNQEFITDLSVPPDVTTVVVSNLSETETRTVQGFAGFAPTDSGLNRQTTELLVTLTPHLTRQNTR